jgi:8-amino-7-oxononanoate synthase
LVSGEAPEHAALEGALAAWLQTDSALLFSSGYAANVGLLGALASAGDRVVSDALNHASIIDGCRLSRADVVVVPHLEVEPVRRALRAPRAAGARAWVVTESYFSMHADSPDLRALRAVCDEAGAGLLVDEAHALGVLGPDGRGLCAAAGVVPDALVGTLGKAFGRQGAFVAGDDVLRHWLWNRARSFVFSTGLSPATAESARWAFEHARATPALRATCLARSAELREQLAPFAPSAPAGPIVPIVLGDAERAVAVARAARAQGLHVQAIRPPTVPAGQARLRLTATALQSADDVAFATSTLRALLESGCVT